MSTIFYILVYGLIGLGISFVTLILARLFELEDDNRIIFAVLSFLIWPIAVVVQLIMLVLTLGVMPFIRKFDEWAKELAKKLK